MVSRFSLALLLSAAASLPARPAHAEDDTPARALFKQGRALASEGKYAEACPKFEESLRLEVGVGTQFNLADCWEHVGKLASAQKLFLGAAGSAKAAGQADREQVLRDRAAALEPRIPKLVVEVADTSPKLSVKRDQLPLDSDQIGKALAVDPGKYEIVAKAPGKKPWSKTVEVAAGSAVVTVEVPVLEVDTPEAPVAAEPAPHAKLAPAPVAKRSPTNYRALGLGVAGVVALGTGAYLGYRYKKSNDDAKDICPSGDHCSINDITKHDHLVDRATTFRSWMYAGIGVGTLAIGGAVALYAFGGEPEPARAWIRAFPAVGANGDVGATVVGGF
ncbi:MAG TPA: tetratricopeptide repeat protein [Polyangiaceae bacterium]|nr:tetratricopeptide repeat protein [Polyangiaceae bacterium]